MTFLHLTGVVPHTCPGPAPRMPSSEHTMAAGPAGSVLATGVERQFSERVISEGDFPKNNRTPFLLFFIVVLSYSLVLD